MSTGGSIFVSGNVFSLDRLGRQTNIVDGIGSRNLVYSDGALPLSHTYISGVLSGLSLMLGYESLL